MQLFNKKFLLFLEKKTPDRVLLLSGENTTGFYSKKSRCEKLIYATNFFCTVPKGLHYLPFLFGSRVPALLRTHRAHQ